MRSDLPLVFNYVQPRAPDSFAVFKKFYEELVTPFAYVEVPGQDDLYSLFEATIDNSARLCESLNLIDVKTLYKSIRPTRQQHTLPYLQRDVPR